MPVDHVPLQGLLQNQSESSKQMLQRKVTSISKENLRQIRKVKVVWSRDIEKDAEATGCVRSS